MFKLIRKRLQNQKGFTLAELMVVMVIIGILIGIAVPSYNKVTATAEKRACEANKRTIKGAVQAYMFENNGSIPLDKIKNDNELEITELNNDDFRSFFDGEEVPQCPSVNQQDDADQDNAYKVKLDIDNKGVIKGVIDVICDYHDVDENDDDDED